MDLEFTNLPVKLNFDFVDCVVKSRIRRSYARLTLEKSALAKVLFLYFGLCNYALIKISHTHNMKLGNGDNMQTDTRSQSWSTRLISVLYVSHKYLISELN